MPRSNVDLGRPGNVEKWLVLRRVSWRKGMDTRQRRRYKSRRSPKTGQPEHKLRRSPKTGQPEHKLDILIRWRFVSAFINGDTWWAVSTMNLGDLPQLTGDDCVADDRDGSGSCPAASTGQTSSMGELHPHPSRRIQPPRERFTGNERPRPVWRNRSWSAS
jgi:hypothetical protein